jgi:DNA-binding HxlR family transcriptional regulator
MANTEVCPVIETINTIGKKWHLVIIYELMKGPKRFNELKNSINGISSKTLSKSLNELRKSKIVDRKVFSDSPIRVEYSLTDKGRDLEEILEVMKHWGERWLVECNSG